LTVIKLLEEIKRLVIRLLLKQ